MVSISLLIRGVYTHIRSERILQFFFPFVPIVSLFVFFFVFAKSQLDYNAYTHIHTYPHTAHRHRHTMHNAGQHYVHWKNYEQFCISIMAACTATCCRHRRSIIARTFPFFQPFHITNDDWSKNDRITDFR